MVAELGIQHFGAFVAAGLLLNLTSGPDLLFVAARAGEAGRRAAWVAALGIGAGCLVHVALGALGVAALLAASPHAYAVLEAAGAAWLVWLGLRMLLARRATVHRAAAAAAAAAAPAAEARAAPARAPAPRPLAGVFRDAMLTNVTNPKIALFFLAFVPQFVAPQAAFPGLAFALLGLVFVLNGTLLTAALGTVVASAADGLRGPGASPRRARALALAASLLPRAIGAIFVGLGLRLALAHR
jgi:threonine/homoserine/homoserine lactone efflux protein